MPKKFKPIDLIKFSKLSEMLGLERSAISKNRCPDKHSKLVESLGKHIKVWTDENLNK